MRRVCRGLAVAGLGIVLGACRHPEGKNDEGELAAPLAECEAYVQKVRGCLGSASDPPLDKSSLAALESSFHVASVVERDRMRARCLHATRTLTEACR